MTYSPPHVATLANDRLWSTQLATTERLRPTHAHQQAQGIATEEHLRIREARNKAEQRPWCLTARHSSAGRGRTHIGQHNDWQVPKHIVNTLANSDAKHPSYIAEEWLTRDTDIGTIGAVMETEPQESTNGHDHSHKPDINVVLLGMHKQLCTPRGKTTGVIVHPGGSLPALAPENQQRIIDTHALVGKQLARIGYRGPFGIDSWTYRLDGRLHLNPLSEINARYSMGWAAHLAAHLHWSKEATHSPANPTNPNCYTFTFA